MSIGTFNENSTWRDVLEFARTEDPNWNYIITGKGGPTGKTFLYNKLKKNGYNAIEISEDIAGLVDYRDNKNHYFVNRAKKQLLIVLNKRIDISRFGKWAIEDDSYIHGGYTLATVGPAWDGFRAGAAEAEHKEWLKKNPHTDVSTLYPETHFIFPGRSGGKVLFTKAWMNAMYGTPLYSIKDVIFNDPATIVFWTDGTKTVVKTQDNEMGDHEIFDPEKGLAMAIAKKALGNKREYYHTFLHWLKEYDRKYYWKSEEFKTDSSKKSPVQKAYDILKDYMNGNEFADLESALGYLGQALED